MAVIAVAASLALAPLALPGSAHASPVKVYVSILKGANEIGPAGGALSHACIDIDPALATEINDNPRGFYWNIHTSVFPAGAIRAQLR